MIKYFACFLSVVIFSLFPLNAALAEQKPFSFLDPPKQVEQVAPVQQVPAITASVKTVRKVMLNAGTRIPVTLYNSVNSNNLKTGDMVGITINKDIYSDGELVFKKGGEGVLFVSDSVKSGGHGKPGRLEINGGRVTDLFGNDHPINLSLSSKGESKRGGAIVATILGVLVILVPFGLWIDGKPATLQGGSQYDALVTSASEIELKQR